MNKYTVTPGINTLTIDLEGKFEEEDAKNFVDDFKKGLSKVQPNSCELIFNAGKLHVVSPDMHNQLKNCFELYQKIGFKKITMFLENNVILGMQVKRLASDAGLSNFEINYV